MTAVRGMCGNQKAFWKTRCTKHLTQLSLLLPGPATTLHTRSLTPALADAEAAWDRQ